MGCSVTNSTIKISNAKQMNWIKGWHGNLDTQPFLLHVLYELPVLLDFKIDCHCGALLQRTIFIYIFTIWTQHAYTTHELIWVWSKQYDFDGNADLFLPTFSKLLGECIGKLVWNFRHIFAHRHFKMHEFNENLYGFSNIRRKNDNNKKAIHHTQLLLLHSSSEWI